VLAKHVRVDPQCDSRISVAEPGGDYVDGDPSKQQCGGVQVTQIMQTCMGQ
jgi:hypothetical protein